VSELDTQLRNGEFAPLYLLYGNEPGPMRRAVEAIRTAVLVEGTEAFNHERFAGRELDSIGPVLDACGQLPFMAARRLVELDDPEAVGKGRGASDSNKKSQDALLQYVGVPNPSTVLVLVSSGVDGRSKLVTAVKKAGVVIKFEQIKRDRDAVDFIRDAAASARVDLRRDAATLLVELVGTGQSELLAALDRAALHAGPGRPVGADDVRAVCTHTREAVIFELTDAVGMRAHERALEVLAQVFTESASGDVGQAAMVLSMLIRQVRLLFTARALGGDAGKIGQVCGLPPFIARKLAQQVRGFDEARLRRAHAGLARLDRDLKGGSFAVAREPYVALQRLILDVCEALPNTAARV
jgi:DNA polymerase-3 subunit delta